MEGTLDCLMQKWYLVYDKNFERSYGRFSKLEEAIAKCNELNCLGYSYCAVFEMVQIFPGF